MSDTTRYGRFYWCVKVEKELSQDGEIYLMADDVRIDDGDLIFVRQREGGTEQINLAIASGDWKAVYAASVWDGAPVAVDHWGGEVVDESGGWIRSALEKSKVDEGEKKELAEIIEALPAASAEEKPTLVKRSGEWLKRNGPTIGVLADQIRRWIELFS